MSGKLNVLRADVSRAVHLFVLAELEQVERVHQKLGRNDGGYHQHLDRVAAEVISIVWKYDAHRGK